jgi:CheY-like chemotaxis protein
MTDASAAPTAAQPGRAIRVLLAEDNPVNQKLATLMLSKLQCSVDLAVDGREAVRLFEQLPYDCVFMDCQMPELDGYGATREIRAREKEGAHIPIIAVTANAMAGDREKCLAAGMDDYIAKPVRASDLAKALQRWVLTNRRPEWSPPA